VSCGQRDRRTDMPKLIVTFGNFANASKNWTLICKCQRANRMNQWGKSYHCNQHVSVIGQFSWMLEYASKRKEYRVAPKNVYTLAAVRRLRQCLDADGGHFEHLHWIQNSRTSLISILFLYKYSSYDCRVICQSVYTFFWPLCI